MQACFFSYTENLPQLLSSADSRRLLKRAFQSSLQQVLHKKPEQILYFIENAAFAGNREQLEARHRLNKDLNPKREERSNKAELR